MHALRPIPLGPFDLIEPVGVGATGTVWRAEHRDTGRAVAIKIVTAAAALGESCQAAMLREVQAVAGFDHPGVLDVHEFGNLPQESAVGSGGVLVAGAPFVVMEFAAGGSLQDAGTRPDWEVVRRVALDILDVLAHAHAHGVIHRDLEPANILHVVSAQTGQTRIALADFGIAHSVDFETRNTDADVAFRETICTPCGPTRKSWARYSAPSSCGMARWAKGPCAGP